MGFVFYDTETTGIATNFDQILQFAAIQTDAELVEVDRIEVRSRLQHHVIPHPGALQVTGLRIRDILGPELKSHYEMVREVRAKLLSWSPAIFVGYNSIGFDEHLLRQAFFQTLHPPYLTNTQGNCRADVLPLVQRASIFAPDCLSVPRDHRGKPVYKLDHIAPTNGHNHANAHDALADVEATIHLARCVKERAPDCWNRFVRFAQKAAALEFIREEEGFLLTEFFANRPYHNVVGYFGEDPDQSNVALCINLALDLDQVENMSSTQLARFAKKSPKPLRRVRTNVGPLICPIEDAPEALLGGLPPSVIVERAQRVKENGPLRERLIAAVVEAKVDREQSQHVEEQLYDDFIARADELRMRAFHEADWSERQSIVETFDDARLRHFGRRLLHADAPHLLEPAHRTELDHLFRQRLMTDVAPKDTWTSLPMALRATEEMLEEASGADAERLQEYKAYLLSRMRNTQSAVR